MPDDLVIVEYQDLLQDPTKVAEKISPLLEKAYGRNNSRAFGVSVVFVLSIQYHGARKFFIFIFSDWNRLPYFTLNIDLGHPWNSRISRI
jgi:hypothetical protein